MTHCLCMLTCYCLPMRGVWAVQEQQGAGKMVYVMGETTCVSKPGEALSSSLPVTGLKLGGPALACDETGLDGALACSQSKLWHAGL